MHPSTRAEVNHQLICQSFQSIFSNKGYMGSVAEKAKLNYLTKSKHKINSQYRVHYFAIGHAFRHINTKAIFKYQLDESVKMELPTAFPALQCNEFNFTINNNGQQTDNLYQLIDDLRNLNAHYLHDFEKINVSNIDKRIIDFLKESFELALIQSCYKLEVQKAESKNIILTGEEKNEILEAVNSSSNQFLLIDFIRKIFYQTLYTTPYHQLKQEQKANKDFIDQFKTSAALIEWILFKELKEDLPWILNKDGDGSSENHRHTLITIIKGKYLSYEACLFLLTMFLYKNEANLLIPKLKGFKKNGNAQDESKLEVFRLFAKKFKGQDIDSNENHLVKFRDIIQYLSKYPLAWNKELENENNAVCEELKKQIQKRELERIYGPYVKEEVFYKYALTTFFNCKDTEQPTLTNQQRKILDAKINMSDELKALYKQLQEQEKKNEIIPPFNRNKLEHKIHTTKSRINAIEKSGDRMFNRNAEKLKLKIRHNTLYQTYGRNQDRFMEFAIRFLAEHNYFGQHARFKMYQFFTGEEQEQYLQEQSGTINFDKLKFHGGKLIYFDTFHNHLSKYPDWDMPFVIENNAAYIQLPDNNKIICLQRGLVIYLLEHALKKSSIKEIGNTLLTYYWQVRQKDFSNAVNILQEQDTIANEQKAGLKKLLPRRLLNQYAPAIKNSQNISALKAILVKAETSEQRYAELWQKAGKTGYLKEFERKNKGKNFKLNFIRKAWNIMYFRDVYMSSKAFSKQQEQDMQKNKEHERGHHKSHHITREEFNNFCRWMYAFDEAPEYKLFLRGLFEQKSFLNNAEFAGLFNHSRSLNELYLNTKKKYELWLNNHSADRTPTKYQLDNYATLLNEGVIHINVSHFINYLKQKGIIDTNSDGALLFKSLENTSHLISSYYLSRTYKQTDKKTKKLFSELNQSKLEDCLLYEMAMYYLKEDGETAAKVKKNVFDILQQDIVFTVNKNSNTEYNIIVPFKDIDKYKQLNAGKQISNFINELPLYLKEVQKEKAIRPVWDFYIRNNNSITIAHINTVNSHLIKSASGFIKCIMSLEEYYIWKQSLALSDSNRLDIKNITYLYTEYFKNDKEIRDLALHFNIPFGSDGRLKNYQVTANYFEKLFLKKEILSVIRQYDDLGFIRRQVTEIFLNQLHNEYFDRASKETKDKKLKAVKAREKYFSEIIKQVLQHG